MSETILKVSLADLSTVRIKHGDGTITEMPLSSLRHQATKLKDYGLISEPERSALVRLGLLVEELADFKLQMEFVVTPRP